MAGILILTRGLPGSGKSTWAMATVAAHDVGGAIRANRDDIRAMLFGPDYSTPIYACEEQVTVVQRAIVTRGLELAQTVIVDDLNLRVRYLRDWARLASKLGAEFQIVDFTDVDLDLCINRDSWRALNGGRQVGEDVIRDLHTRFIAGAKPLPDLNVAPAPTAKPYTGTPGKPKAVIIDVDGTLANHGERNPYDTSRYHEDTPHPEVVEQVKLAADAGYLLLVTSGRSDEFYTVTDAWLGEHLGEAWDCNINNRLIMRKAGDNRNDAVVKLELFDAEIRDHYDVRWAWDDRDRVVAAWRSIGLPVNQVRPGDF